MRSLIAGVLLGSLASASQAQEQPPPPQASPVVRDVRVTGAKELAEVEVLSTARVRVGEPLPDRPERLAQAVEQRYRDDGYSFATVKAAFDERSATLALTIDEGIVDRVEFLGVGASLATTFVDEFALRAGDVFNRKRAMEALDVLLRPTRGAIRPGANAFVRGAHASIRRPTFDRVDRNGERVLLVGLTEPPGRVRVVPDMGDREDWFTPVDGLVPSVGFGAALFDHRRFNHTYLAGHLSYKAASDRIGYAVGVERPFFDSTKVFVGGELFGLTATDDRWQVSTTEATWAAIGPRRSFRDYYERRGVQVSAAVRPHRQFEALFAWRTEEQEALQTRTEFSVWNNDEAFRPNLEAASGHLGALVVGAVLDSEGFAQESLDATYRRHQLEDAFGLRVASLEEHGAPKSVWRVNWSSEIASPERFGGDFQFRRHILAGRARVRLRPFQEIAARVIGGWSDGLLPPQRQFAIGGMGSVHGYDYKQTVGDTLSLVNVEYAVGSEGVKAIGFFDAGRVTSSWSPYAPWLRGIGFGVGLGGLRIDVGYPLDADRKAPRVVVRLGRTF